MAGTIHASVDHYIKIPDSVVSKMLQATFVTVYNFLNSHWTRIAANFGTTIGSVADGNGFNYFDEASNQAGNNAFAVFRTNGNALPPYNVVLSWSPATWSGLRIAGVTSTPAVGLGGCILDNGQDAWAGTTANDGSDTVSSPVWSIGAASKLFTFNPYNELGGARETQKDTLLSLKQNTTNSGYTILHMYMDDDSFMSFQQLDTAGSYTPLFLGKYLSLESFDLPCVGFIHTNPWIPTVSLSNTGFFGEVNSSTGAVLSNAGTNRGVSSMSLHNYTSLNHAAFNYLSYSPTPNVGAFGGAIMIADNGIASSSTGPIRAPVGFVDPRFMKSGTGLAPNSVVTDEDNRKKLVIGRSSSGTGNWDNQMQIIPWHNGGPPGRNKTRTGIQFEVT